MKTLSDEELMEVTGGLVQLINPSTCKGVPKAKCVHNGNCKCGWSETYKECYGGCL